MKAKKLNQNQIELIGLICAKFNLQIIITNPFCVAIDFISFDGIIDHVTDCIKLNKLHCIINLKDKFLTIYN